MLATKLSNTGKRHLPFVVIGAVPARATGAVLAFDVKTQVVERIVGLYPVHVVNQLPRFERATKVAGHNHSVFANAHGLAHRLEEPKVGIGNRARAKHHVASAVDPTRTTCITAFLMPAGEAIARPHQHAGSAMTAVFMALHLLAQRVKRECSNLAASWASHVGNYRVPAILALFPVRAADCGVRRNAFKTDRAAHAAL